MPCDLFQTSLKQVMLIHTLAMYKYSDGVRDAFSTSQFLHSIVHILIVILLDACDPLASLASRVDGESRYNNTVVNSWCVNDERSIARNCADGLYFGKNLRISCSF